MYDYRISITKTLSRFFIIKEYNCFTILSQFLLDNGKSAICIHMSSLLDVPPTSIPPLQVISNTQLTILCFIVGSQQLSTSHVVSYVYVSPNLPIHPTPPFPTPTSQSVLLINSLNRSLQSLFVSSLTINQLLSGDTVFLCLYVSQILPIHTHTEFGAAFW